MTQDKLRRILDRMKKQCPHWFDVDVRTMAHDVYERMSPLAQSLMEALNFFKPGGIRDASEYLTLEGHLQMWCDANDWEWWIDRERDVFRFGKLVGKKRRRCRHVVLQCCVDGEGMNLVIREFVREPRLKEKNLEEVAA